MSLDSIIQTTTRTVVANFATPGLNYRTSPAGSFAPIVAKFHADATQAIATDDTHAMSAMPMTARLKVPDNGIELPVNVIGQEAQIQEANGNVWAVIGKSRHLGQTFYNLTRTVPINLGHPNGSIP